MIASDAIYSMSRVAGSHSVVNGKSTGCKENLLWICQQELNSGLKQQSLWIGFLVYLQMQMGKFKCVNDNRMQGTLNDWWSLVKNKTLFENLYWAVSDTMHSQKQEELFTFQYNQCGWLSHLEGVSTDRTLLRKWIVKIWKIAMLTRLGRATYQVISC